MPRPSSSLFAIVFIAIAPWLNAAPLTEVEPTAPRSPDKPAAPPARTQAGEQRETLDLLIEMQPQSPGLNFNERAARPQRQAPDVGRAAQALPARTETATEPPVPTTKSGLFGSDAADPGAATRKTEVPTGSSPSATPMSGPAPRPGGPQLEEDLPGAYRFLRSAVSYLRENREWAIGGVLTTLAVLWLAGGGLRRGR